MQALYAGTCRSCGTEIKHGTTIKKVGNHWCSNPDCGKPKESLFSDMPQSEKMVEEWQKLHVKVWDFAVSEANRVRPEADTISKSILSQVFYKKCMDYAIHH